MERPGLDHCVARLTMPPHDHRHLRAAAVLTVARIAPAEGRLDPAAQAELNRQLAAHGRVTNMKRTLAHSPRALLALMEWYPLRDEVKAFLGDRATTLFAHAVSSENDCLICSTFFRRILEDAGDDPDRLQLDARERALVDYGVALSRDRGRVPDDVYAGIAGLLTPAQIVAVTAFGTMMIATNAFVNALEIELDEYLWPYRKPEARA
jgi:alkylhydroperoxidase family enzyme